MTSHAIVSATESNRVDRDQMTKGQIEAYLTAYNSQDDEKDW